MKKAKLDKKGKGKKLDDETKPRSGTKIIDGKKLLSFLKRVETVKGTINAIMDEAAKECQPHRDDIKNIVKEAAEAGFPKKLFKTKLKERRLQDDLENITDQLDKDQKEEYDLFSHALMTLEQTRGKVLKEEQPEGAGLQ